MRAVWAFCMCLAGLALLGASSAQAQIFRWTDAEGKVHFGEQAPDANAQPIEVNPQIMERDPATRASQARTDKIFAAREQEQQQARNNRAAEQARQNQECAGLRRKLADVSHDGRYFKINTNGEKAYYSEQEVAGVRNGLTNKIAERCN